MVDGSRLVGWLAAEWAQGGHRGMLGLFLPQNGRIRAGTRKPGDAAKSADADWRCSEGSVDSSKLGRRPSPHRHPSDYTASPGHERSHSRLHGKTRKRDRGEKGLGIGHWGFVVLCVPLCLSVAQQQRGSHKEAQGGRREYGDLGEKCEVRSAKWGFVIREFL